jgi:hypothetical protein
MTARAMKVPIDEVAVISLDAPVLSAYEARVKGVTRWFVWCRYWREWHSHGPGAGHREAHCLDQSSPYWKTGYNLAFAGKVERGS